LPHQYDITLKLLISPSNEKEAEEAIAGGADIIDVKNPSEGPLGANFPWVIKRIREITPKKLQVSCALGDVPNLPGSISLAALGAASLGVDYIKVGLYGVKTPDQALKLLESVNRAAKECNPKIKVAAAGYADAKKINSINPLLLPEIANQAKIDVVMIDTYTKQGKNLFDNLTTMQVKTFVDCAHSLGLEVALAGSLKKQDLPLVSSLGADIVGLRGAACSRGNRVEGEITRELVSDLLKTVKQADDTKKRA
jgi:uncharacterized protein (UPF0264 family)